MALGDAVADCMFVVSTVCLKRMNPTLSHLQSQAMKRYAKIGAVIGFLAGVVVFLGYIATSWWVCSTLLDCPGHWLPYAVIFTIGLTFFTAAGAIAAAILRGLYEMFRIDGGPSP